MAELKPAYLIQGDDELKLDAWRRRLRARAQSEDPPAALEVLDAERTSAEDIALAFDQLSLGIGTRYILVEGVERLSAKDAEAVADALGSLAPATVILLVATGPKRRVKGKWIPPAPDALVKAVKALGGDVHVCAAPTAAKLSGWVAEYARDHGLVMSEDAVHALIERVGFDEKKHVRQQRIVRELEKLAVFAPEDGRVDRDAVEALTVSDVEARAFELADALVAEDSERALRLAEDLRDRGAELMHILFALLRQLRQARRAAALVETGASTQELAGALRVPPFVAKQIASRAAHADAAHLERAIDALADLDYAVRGAGNVDPATALTLTLAGAA